MARMRKTTIKWMKKSKKKKAIITLCGKIKRKASKQQKHNKSRLLFTCKLKISPRTIEREQARQFSSLRTSNNNNTGNDMPWSAGHRTCFVCFCFNIFFPSALQLMQNGIKEK